MEGMSMGKSRANVLAASKEARVAMIGCRMCIPFLTDDDALIESV
jgi:hypothetical protein